MKKCFFAFGREQCSLNDTVYMYKTCVEDSHTIGSEALSLGGLIATNKRTNEQTNTYRNSTKKKTLVLSNIVGINSNLANFDNISREKK